VFKDSWRTRSETNPSKPVVSVCTNDLYLRPFQRNVEGARCGVGGLARSPPRALSKKGGEDLSHVAPRTILPQGRRMAQADHLARADGGFRRDVRWLCCRGCDGTKRAQLVPCDGLFGLSIDPCIRLQRSSAPCIPLVRPGEPKPRGDKHLGRVAENPLCHLSGAFSRVELCLVRPSG